MKTKYLFAILCAAAIGICSPMMAREHGRDHERGERGDRERGHEDRGDRENGEREGEGRGDRENERSNRGEGWGNRSNGNNRDNSNFAREHPRREEVNDRQQNQQGRIANGVKNGTLQPNETAHIEKQEAGIKQQERQDVKANGGYLTKGEQKQINSEENHVSKEIYTDKHNEGTTPSSGSSQKPGNSSTTGAPQANGGSTPATGGSSFAQEHPRRAEVNGRQENQQDRIANGIQNGTLSAGEASHIENQEANIKKQEVQDVKANGGYLTKGEQKQINSEENHVSKEIYKDKHNEGTAPASGGSSSSGASSTSSGSSSSSSSSSSGQNSN